MKKTFYAITFALMFLLVVGMSIPTQSFATTVTIDIEAYIDGRDRVSIQGNTLTWQHFENDWPGTNNGHNDPVTVITSVDGIVAERYSWWHRPNSNIPLTITPGVPSTDNFTLTPLQARSSLWTVQSPNMANNYTTVIEFDDNGPPGAEWYEAKLDYTSNTPVPIPPAFLLLGPGLVGIAAIRRRLNK